MNRLRVLGILLVAFGLIFLLPQLPQDLLVPLTLLAAGISLLVHTRQRAS
jgi:hypothetical protein